MAVRVAGGGGCELRDIPQHAGDPLSTLPPGDHLCAHKFYPAPNTQSLDPYVARSHQPPTHSIPLFFICTFTYASSSLLSSSPENVLLSHCLLSTHDPPFRLVAYLLPLGHFVQIPLSGDLHGLDDGVDGNDRRVGPRRPVRRLFGVLGWEQTLSLRVGRVRKVGAGRGNRFSCVRSNVLLRLVD
jgi:hypothetical protein